MPFSHAATNRAPSAPPILPSSHPPPSPSPTRPHPHTSTRSAILATPSLSRRFTVGSMSISRRFTVGFMSVSCRFHVDLLSLLRRFSRTFLPTPPHNPRRSHNFPPTLR